jgi:hypothetical protein
MLRKFPVALPAVALLLLAPGAPARADLIYSSSTFDNAPVFPIDKTAISGGFSNLSVLARLTGTQSAPGAPLPTPSSGSFELPIGNFLVDVVPIGGFPSNPTIKPSVGVQLTDVTSGESGTLLLDDSSTGTFSQIGVPQGQLLTNLSSNYTNAQAIGPHAVGPASLKLGNTIYSISSTGTLSPVLQPLGTGRSVLPVSLTVTATRVAAVPEPGPLALAALGGASVALAGYARRTKKG